MVAKFVLNLDQYFNMIYNF